MRVEILQALWRRLAAIISALVAALAPDAIVDRVAQWIRALPPARLEWLMRSPARRLVLGGIFWQMPRHLDRRRAAAVTAAIRWQITGRADGGQDTFDVVLTDGRARVKRGGGAEVPRLTITIDGAEFLRVAVGSSNPVNAYLNGKLALRGDVMQAARLTMLFRIPTGASGSPASQPPNVT